MKVKLLGVRPVEFPDDKTGEMVKGMSLYITYPDSDVYGVIADKKFINISVADRLNINIETLVKSINSDIDIELNPRGRLSSITVCNK